MTELHDEAAPRRFAPATLEREPKTGCPARLASKTPPRFFAQRCATSVTVPGRLACR